MYKLIAIDLDGTLLNTYGEISENTKSAIKKAKQNGSEVIIASGRSLDSLKVFADEISSNRYIIAGNGSIIYDIQKKEIIYEKCIPKIKALNIIKMCEENSITYSVYTNDKIIADSLRYNILYYYKQNLKKDPSKKTNIVIVSNIYDYIKNNDEKVMKISICDKHKSVFNSILKAFSEFDGIKLLDISHASRKVITNGTEEVTIEYFYTEIIEKNVDKWHALHYLSKLLNISTNEIMTIGDNINDKKMIEQAGLGIAMKGSLDQVINVANHVSDFDNDHDGVAKSIEKYIFNE